MLKIGNQIASSGKNQPVKKGNEWTTQILTTS
jgi:hypothetical protein